jgi:hypothetical protein
MKFGLRMFKKKTLIQVMMVLTLTACASMPPKATVDLKKGDYTYAKAYMNWFIGMERTMSPVMNRCHLYCTPQCLQQWGLYSLNRPWPKEKVFSGLP